MSSSSNEEDEILMQLFDEESQRTGSKIVDLKRAREICKETCPETYMGMTGLSEFSLLWDKYRASKKDK